MDLSLDQEEAAFLKDVLAESVAGPPRTVHGALKPSPSSAQAGSALPAASTQNHVHAQPPRSAPIPPGTPPTYGVTTLSASRPPHAASKQPLPTSPVRAASSPGRTQVLRPPPIRMQSSEVSNRPQGVAAPGAVAPAATVPASRHPGQAYALPSSPTRSNTSHASLSPDRRPQSGASHSVTSLPSLDGNSAARKEKEQERQAQAEQQLQVVRRLEVQAELLLSETAGEAALPLGQAHQGWVHVVAEGLVRDYNKAAVALMEAGALSEAKEQLDRALTLSGEGGPLAGRADLQRRMQALAHNNLALCYRRMEQSELCVRHLELAAQLEAQQAAEDAAAAAPSTRTSCNDGGGGVIPAEGRVRRTRSRLSKGVLGSRSLNGRGVGAGSGSGAADAGQAAHADASVATLLSLAAASSSVGRHKEALSYAHRAVLAAARELQVQLAVLECALLDGLTQVELCGEVLPQLRAADPRLLTQLAMAYFNRAVEQEHVQQWYPALESYRFALDLATRFAGKGSELTMRMQKDSEAYKARLRKLERSFKVRPDGTTNHTLIAATLPGTDGSLPPSASAFSARSRSPNGRSSRTTSTRSFALSACGSGPSSRATTSSGQATSPRGPALPSSSRGPLASTRSQQRISPQPQSLRTSLSGLPAGPLKGTRSARGRFVGLATEASGAEGPRGGPGPLSSSLDGSSRAVLPGPGVPRAGPGGVGSKGRLSNAGGMARSGAGGGGTAGSGANGGAAGSSQACGAVGKGPVEEKAAAVVDATRGGGPEGTVPEDSGTAAEAESLGGAPPPVESGPAEEADGSMAGGDSPERLTELSFAFDSAVRPKQHKQQKRASQVPGSTAVGEQHGEDGDGESVSEFWDSDESESGPSFFADRLKSVRCTTKRVSDAPLRPSFDIKPWQGPQQGQAAITTPPMHAAAGGPSPAAQPPTASADTNYPAGEVVQDLEVTLASHVGFPVAAAAATAAALAHTGSVSGQEHQAEGEEGEQGEGAESEASQFWDSDESESGPSFLAERLKSVRCTTKRVSDAPLMPSFTIEPWQGPQQQQGAANAKPAPADAPSPAFTFAAASEPAPAGAAGSVAPAPAPDAASAHCAAVSADAPAAGAAANAGQEEEEQGEEAVSEASEFWDSDESESGPSFLAERLKSVRCTTKRVSDAPLIPSFEIKPWQNGNAQPTTAPARATAPTAALPASPDHTTARSVPSGNEGAAKAEPVAPMQPPSVVQQSPAPVPVPDTTLALAAAVAALPRPTSGRGASDGGHSVLPGASSMLAPKRNGLAV